MEDLEAQDCYGCIGGWSRVGKVGISRDGRGRKEQVMEWIYALLWWEVSVSRQ